MNANVDQITLETFASIEAEQSILGGLLLNNGLFDVVGDRLKAEDFSLSAYRDVYAEITKQLRAGQACDVVTVGVALGEDRISFGDLNALAQFVPSAGNVRRYAELVEARSKSRSLRNVSAEIAEIAQDHDKPIGDRVDQAQGLLSKLIDEMPRDEWVGAYAGMVKHSAVLDARAVGTSEAWPTGLADLDEYLEGGLRPGELVIVGARPSMGKTALGMTIASHMAANRPVAMLSMEMSCMDVFDRLTAMLGNVSMSAVKRPTKGAGLQWDRVMEGVDKAKSLRFQISDQGGLNLHQVRQKARNAKRLFGLDVLVIDYIGLMTGLDPRATRNAQLGEISRGLKTLAKELQICVVCLAQLNRKSEDRPEQMPQMSDLRDSGEIEQDADVILFIKRPIMANPELGDEWRYYAKLSIAKNRQGRCGVLDLSYLGEQTRFASWSGPAPSKSMVKNGRGME